MRRRLVTRLATALAVIALLTAGAGLFARPAAAADVPEAARQMGLADSWEGMSEAQRKDVLEKYRRFMSLPPEKRRRLRENYERFRAMSPEQKTRLKERYTRFNRMSRDERERLKKDVEVFRRIPREKRADIKNRLKRFRGLPPKERESRRLELRRQLESEGLELPRRSRARRTPAAKLDGGRNGQGHWKRDSGQGPAPGRDGEGSRSDESGSWRREP